MTEINLEELYNQISEAIAKVDCGKIWVVQFFWRTAYICW